MDNALTKILKLSTAAILATSLSLPARAQQQGGDQSAQQQSGPQTQQQTTPARQQTAKKQSAPRQSQKQQAAKQQKRTSQNAPRVAANQNQYSANHDTASNKDVRQFHEVLNDLLSEFAYDVKQGQINGLKNVAIRRVDISDTLPRTYEQYVELLVTERVRENSKVKLIQLRPVQIKIINDG